MITTNNFKDMLISLNFVENTLNQYHKEYPNGSKIIVDFTKEQIIYPEDDGFKINVRTTCNFSQQENFVVFECIDRLFSKGYRAEHIEIEKKWTLGHDEKSGRADICIHEPNRKGLLGIIECKTYGKEFNEALKTLKIDGGQLFSYWQQERSVKWLILYSSDYEDKKVIYKCESINCSDDPNIALLAKKDESIVLYSSCGNSVDLYNCWKNTYDFQLNGDVIFSDDTQAYVIGVKPLRKKDLVDFSTEDKIVNKFEEILRHNNVSDKENAFNRLTALFICKLVDEINKSDDDIVEFQYKVGSDTYESLQDRLQKLHKLGMDKFMREKIFYVADDYAEKLIQQYTGKARKKLIDELNSTLRILKFYTNNDFAFKDVHNEELFYQNGKVLVEVVQLFQKFRIINSNNLQLLGDLFEQLLNKGFKQNEGQFFTPVPITRFIARSLPIEELMTNNSQQNYPKVIDYACGAGHFLTEAFEEIQKIANKNSFGTNYTWLKDKIFGIEKDYRLSRVSKIMLFMHGAGDGNIIFGDGLDSYPDKDIENETFDILVANPPYSVSAFKPHLRLKNNKDLKLLSLISNDGSEIETIFVERASQLLKPGGVAGIILPSSLLTKKSGSFVGAREILIKNFRIRSIVSMGKKTFGATGTPTIILFLEKNTYPPKREDQVEDTVAAIFNSSYIDDLNEWEDKKVIEEYCNQINVPIDAYFSFINRKSDYKDYKDDTYFKRYYENLLNSSEYKAKTKQKTFKKKSIEEKNKDINKLFYDLSHSIEKDKLSIFGFVYCQKTLVVLAPEDNKEEQQFLGYSWSDRKGQEGIQIKKMGGKLFDENNQGDKDKFDYLIHNCFNDKQFDSEILQNYYFYSDLKDLIDFDSFSFDKVIKLVQKRKLKTEPEYKTYRLSDIKVFELNIGKRVLEEDLVSSDAKDAIPVYSANVKECFGFLNKNIVSDFSSPSILWSIDGNWMVNYIEDNVKFYPTDHCGYLRIKSDDILPKYFMYALEVEGRFQRFNRNNRASMTALKSLAIQIPSLETQTKIVDKLDKIDNKIFALNKKIGALKSSILTYIKELFGSKKNDALIKDWYNVEKGTTITEKEANEGEVPVVAGGTGPAYYHDTSNRPANIITVSASGSSGFVNYWNVPIFASDCNTIISKNEDEAPTIYLYYFLKLHQEDVYALRKGLQPSHVYAEDLKNFKFYKPDKNENDLFLKFIKKIEDDIEPLVKQVEEKKSEKNQIIFDHFIK